MSETKAVQVATEMTTAAALVTGGTSMAGAIEVVEVEVRVERLDGRPFDTSLSDVCFFYFLKRQVAHLLIAPSLLGFV